MSKAFFEVIKAVIYCEMFACLYVALAGGFQQAVNTLRAWLSYPVLEERGNA